MSLNSFNTSNEFSPSEDRVEQTSRPKGNKSLEDNDTLVKDHTSAKRPTKDKVDQIHYRAIRYSANDKTAHA